MENDRTGAVECRFQLLAFGNACDAVILANVPNLREQLQCGSSQIGGHIVMELLCLLLLHCGEIRICIRHSICLCPTLQIVFDRGFRVIRAHHNLLELLCRVSCHIAQK